MLRKLMKRLRYQEMWEKCSNTQERKEVFELLLAETLVLMDLVEQSLGVEALTATNSIHGGNKDER